MTETLTRMKIMYNQNNCPRKQELKCGMCQYGVCTQGIEMECADCLLFHAKCVYIMTGVDVSVYVDKLRKKSMSRFCIKCEDKYDSSKSHTCAEDNTKDYLDVLRELK